MQNSSYDLVQIIMEDQSGYILPLIAVIALAMIAISVVCVVMDDGGTKAKNKP